MDTETWARKASICTENNNESESAEILLCIERSCLSSKLGSCNNCCMCQSVVYTHLWCTLSYGVHSSDASNMLECKLLVPSTQFNIIIIITSTSLTKKFLGNIQSWQQKISSETPYLCFISTFWHDYCTLHCICNIWNQRNSNELMSNEMYASWDFDRGCQGHLISHSQRFSTVRFILHFTISPIYVCKSDLYRIHLYTPKLT